MKEHFCPAEKSMIAFEKECNWCGEREPQIAFNAEVVGYVAPQRTWVGLTDEEENEYNYLGPDMHWVIQEIAAKLKELNT